MTAYLKGVEMPVKHTDKERRRLAENLRGGYDVTWNANGLFWLNGTLFGMDICARRRFATACVASLRLSNQSQS